jgi:hypothetical protein
MDLSSVEETLSLIRNTLTATEARLKIAPQRSTLAEPQRGLSAHVSVFMEGGRRCVCARELTTLAADVASFSSSRRGKWGA